MSYHIQRVCDWSLDKLAPYNHELSQAIAKIAMRFPDDINLEKLTQNIINGHTDLWLILDENNAFIAFLTTELEIAESGKKRLLLLELAGKGSLDLTMVLPDLELFAKAQGAEQICPYGRLGWKRALAQKGYKIATIKYVKDL